MPGSKPVIAVAVFGDREYLIVRQTIARREMGDFPVLHPVYAAITRAQPERAFPVLIHRQNDVTGEAFPGSERREGGIPQAIESASGASDPQAALPILCYCPYIISREAFFRGKPRERSAIEPVNAAS